MDLNQEATTSQGSSGTIPGGTLSGRWLVILRSAWIGLALVEFVLFIAGIFAYAIQLQTVCTNTIHTTCNFWQPTPGNARVLAHLGISLGEYAAYFLTVDVLVSLVFWAMGVLIFWRKSDTRIGLFVSLLLVMFGGCRYLDYPEYSVQGIVRPTSGRRAALPADLHPVLGSCCLPVDVS
jgi:hypothetical protein